MPRTSALEKSILATIAYTDQFEYPLTVDEVWSRLTGTQHQKKRLRDVAQALRLLVQQQQLIQRQEFFMLIDKENYATQRKNRENIAKGKWHDAQLFVRKTKSIPWIQAIFVTGSLAMNNTEPEDDVDLMIVTSEKRLWLTRLIVMCIAISAGKRRSWQEKKHRGWCLNLWLDTAHLTMPLNKRSVYQAYEVMQAKPIWSRGTTVATFYTQNHWVSDFLPNWRPKDWGEVQQSTQQPLMLFSSFFDIVEWFCWKLQMWYMKPHQTTERVAREYAFFHPRDTQHLIEKKWQKTLTHLYH